MPWYERGLLKPCHFDGNYAEKIDRYIRHLEDILRDHSAPKTDAAIQSKEDIQSICEELYYYRLSSQNSRCYVFITRLCITLDPTAHYFKDFHIPVEPLDINLTAQHRAFVIFATRNFFDSLIVRPPRPQATAGEQTIHRIWVGKTPSMRTLYQVMHSNKAIARSWRNKGKRVNPTYILWTNCKALFAMADANEKLLNHFEVRDIDFLLGHNKTPLAMELEARSALHWQRFSYCVDVLKILVLYHFGGLYLDMSWINDPMTGSIYEESSVDPFAPDSEDIIIPTEKDQKMKVFNPFTSREWSNAIPPVGEPHEWSPWASLSSFEVNFLYAGKPHSDFYSYVLDLTNNTYSQQKYQESKEHLLIAVHGYGEHGETIFTPNTFEVSPGTLLWYALQSASIRFLFEHNAPLTLSLPDRNSFDITYNRYNLRALAPFKIMADSLRSWTKYNAKLEGSSESPL